MIHEALSTAAARFGDRVAIRTAKEDWSFGALDAASRALAARLSEAGVGRGDRVAIMSSNRIEFPVAVNAISRIGAAAILLSPAWKDAEASHGLELTKPCHAIADGDGVAILRGHLGDEAVMDLDAAAMSEILRVDASASAQDVAESPIGNPVAIEDDEAVLVFSSGTTGMPKAVRHSHASLAAATEHWIAVLGLGPDDRFQISTPPSHILGLLNLLAAATAGATVRLHARFDLDTELRSIQEDRMTLEMAVAPIVLAMANHPELESFDLSSLRYIMWGATPVSESVAEAVSAKAGVRFLPAYGASELPVLTCNPVERPHAWRLDSVGLPAPGVELRVVNLETGAILPSGETGEIQALSPSRMLGYLPEEASQEVLDGDWYRTGDVGSIDAEGWVQITDRSKEMIKVSGFQVAPAEVEAVLHSHPSVVDCAVFGVPDGRSGEAPVAAVQLDPASPVEPEILTALVASKLARYKHLRSIEIIDLIPRLPSGKVLRRTLRDEWLRTNA
ncbi:MAG: class I adenylate-forming enzyme family protein [Myxococcota bacterium]